MSDKKQSSVDWLYNELFPKQIDGFSENEWKIIDKAFKRAKELHKEEVTSFTADWSIQWKKEDGVSINKYYHQIFEEDIENKTPKQKAEEIFYKMLKQSISSNDISAIFRAKQSSLILVDEILNNFGSLTEGKQHYSAHYTIQFYQQVKEEIKKL